VCLSYDQTLACDQCPLLALNGHADSRLTTRALDCRGETMQRQQFSPAARRSGGGIAAVIGVLVTLAAEDRTQAQNAPRVSRILSDASVLNPSKLAGSEEDLRGPGYVEGRNIGENSAGKISSAGGSGGRRCEMSPEEFAKSYPPLLDWIRTTLTASARVAQTVVSRGFSRLPLYFTEKILASTKVVLVDPLPMPPLSSMGLVRFADFERGDFDGITYIDTIFLKPTQSNNENMHFHELVHVIQWRLLGPDRFLFSYANGLECFGYRQSPLEAMAYDAETAFASSTAIFNVEKMVAEKLGL
jgi:hypothetical protein